jgi:hypothetical protein
MKNATHAVVLALGLFSASVLTGCAEDRAASFEAAPSRGAATVKADATALVGTWHFVYDDVRRAAVEAELAAKITDPTELAAAKADAVAEAASSEIELTKDGLFLSRIDGQEIARAPYSAKGNGVLDVTLHKGAETMTTQVELRDGGNMIVVHDPKKGELFFKKG